MNGEGLVKADLGDGRLVHVEVRTSGDPETDVRTGDVLSIDGFIDSVDGIAQSVASTLRRVRPDRATVEFGLDVGVEAGGLTALLVKGTGAATLKLTLEWQSDASVAAGDG